ncbi:flavin-containing monooxygenase [Salinisphaera hydrothermalis]|uniref:FAD dependent oxidoreductase n=1 Tax=Salinisphaera hydrothermalis (strain C41B8) TaxID=1304275 RepID=A0A084IIU5_SALHC|nr:NAD(P)/FAD-dependent oxidoreductase [Salinisphaera hydrothermalis]KEZ76629.1 FAD dependent oxidoreductase [Salinisphaera hydrothermalis C41B8]
MAAISLLSQFNPLANRTIDTDMDIAIVGAGFSGLGMAIQLKEAGVENFTLIERGDEVGGTWRDNHYPGAACDVASHLYSFSFEQNPNWSRAFGQQPEIFDYIKRVAAKYDLYRHIRFNTAIREARFDEDAGIWHATTDGGEEITARVMISAVGALSDPAYPKIEGLEHFRGKLMHTAQWDDDYDLTGKRVAVIGSGASAIQVVPEIQKQAGQMTVFQRTPSWIMPKPDRPIPEKEQSEYRESPFKLSKRRYRIYWMSELFAPFIISDRPFFKKRAAQIAKSHIRKQVADPALRETVTPDYAIGCKRILISNDWYPAIQADNAELIADGPARITEHSIITKDGREIEVDAIVCATGFKVPSRAAPFPVKGLGGNDLNAAWADGAEAYKGVTVSGFPNLFFLMGPNTGPSHTSVLAFTEMQMEYIAKAIGHMARHDLKWMTVKKSVQDRFNRGIQKRMKHTSWTSGCNSWYLTDSGKNTTLYPGFNWEYRMRLWLFRPSEYESAPMRRGAESSRAAA